MMAFHQLEPFGALQQEWMAGQICATMANLQRARNQPAWIAADFMPALSAAMGPQLPQTFSNPDDQAAAIDRLLGL